MSKQSGPIIPVFGFLLVGMATSTVYFVSNGAGANMRLASIRKQLNEQCAKSEAVAAELAAKGGRLKEIEKQHQKLSTSHNEQRKVLNEDQLSIKNQMSTLEAKLSKSKADTLSAQNELKHVLEQFNKVESTLKKRAVDSEQSKAEAEENVQAEKAKVAMAVAREAEARGALLESSRVVQALRVELAKLKSGNLSKTSAIPSPQVPERTSLLVPAQPRPEIIERIDLPEIASPVSVPKPVIPVGKPPVLPVLALPKDAIVGRVAGIELKHGFIICQMSTVHGVGLGNSLIVTRSGEYVGLVRVSRADKDRNIVYAELNAAQLVRGIEEGDQVVLKQ